MAALLVHQAALGDWLLVWPILRALAQSHARVFAASAWSKARLAGRFIPGVQPVNADGQAWSSLHAPHADPPVDLLRTGDDIQLIISFVSTGRDAWSDNAARLWPGARRLYVNPRPPDDRPGHVCDFHLRQLADQGLMIAAPAVPVRFNRRGPILLHPGSGGGDKCWPVARFEALAASLAPLGRPIIPILGPVEVERWPAPQLDRWRRGLNAKVCLDLDPLADAIVAAGIWIGNDSGPTHLAAQLGLPAVALFGPTSPDRWAPRGPAVTLLAPPAPAPMTWLDAPAVVRAVQQIEEPDLSQSL